MMLSLRSPRVFVIMGAVLTLGVAACSSAAAPASSGGGQAAQGQPHAGGTLYMLGTGDVDFMDPDITYYTVGYENLRMWDRPLMSYPAVQGKTTSLIPDLAAAPPTDFVEHAATPTSVARTPTIAKVREARNERLIRSPFQNWHLLDATSDMDIQTTASPAAAIARALHIRTDRHCYVIITKTEAMHRNLHLCSDAEHSFVP